MIAIRELDSPYRSEAAHATTVATPSCCCCCCCCLATAATAPVLAGRIAWKASVELAERSSSSSPPATPSLTWAILSALWPLAAFGIWVVLAIVGDQFLGPISSFGGELVVFLPSLLSVAWLAFTWNKAGVSSAASIVGSIGTHIGISIMAAIELGLVIGGAFVIWGATQENAAISWTVGLGLWAAAAAFCVWVTVKATKPKPQISRAAVRGSQPHLFDATQQSQDQNMRPPLIVDYQANPTAVGQPPPTQNAQYQPINQNPNPVPTNFDNSNAPTSPPYKPLPASSDPTRPPNTDDWPPSS